MLKDKSKIQVFIVLSLIILATLISKSFSLSESIDDEAREISYLLMCPVCQGQSVAESNSDLAKDMRSIIRQKLEAGESKEKIINYFVDRYGESILGYPPVKGVNLLLWILPALAVVLGGIGIGLFLHRSKAITGQEINIGKVENTKEDKEYLKMVDKDLKDLDK
ncbi:MAG TPA: cytochrome c-type biogenesis protein [Thermodesulfobacteriota bacterium]